jgi:glycine betaine/choline ABC-type transport system substrate-binding protein
MKRLNIAADSASEQKLFHDIYKELIEINTTSGRRNSTTDGSSCICS